MNFLSHFYFEKKQTDNYVVLGVVLPDLLKNTDKSWNIHPQKNPSQFEKNQQFSAILEGWKRHLEVDRIFHSSNFFETQLQKIKPFLEPVISHSPIRASFLSHIAIELLLDHLLICEQKINVLGFYTYLQQSDPNIITNFLKLNAVPDPEKFVVFFDRFIQSHYLLSYDRCENIAYALNRICLRVWPTGLDEDRRAELSQALEMYKQQLKENFMVIFDEIEQKLAI